MLRLLKGRTLSKETKEFQKCVEWIKFFPKELNESLRQLLITTVKETFQVSDADLVGACSEDVFAKRQTVVATQDPGMLREQRLRELLPPDSWLSWYADWTQYTESPLSFHVFGSLCALGAALGRRVYLKWGFGSLFPNYCAILIGPTGRVMKTSAIDIPISLIRDGVICPILADRLTPEAMVTALKTSGHHFVPAPEFSVFVNKQKYNDSFVPQLLRLLDCPAVYKVSTVGRGEEVVENIALTILGGSTPNLLVDSSAREVISGGFLNRFVLVPEDDSPRCVSRPRQGPAHLGEKIKRTLEYFAGLSGEMYFSPAADKWWDGWYRARKELIRKSDETTAEVIQRGQIHVLRTALLIHLSTCDSLELCESCLQRGAKLMAFLEASTPQLLNTLTASSTAAEGDNLIKILTRLGGVADHSELLRRSRMDAASFKRHITTHIESGKIVEQRRGAVRCYTLPETKHG